MFNTLRYAKKLEAAGVSREQAEAQIQIIAEILEEDMATKVDINNAKDELKVDIHNVRAELHSVKVELKSDLNTLKTEVYVIKDDLKKDIGNLRTELYVVRDDLKKDMNNLRTEMHVIRDDLKKEFSILEHKLALKLGTIVTVAITAMTAVIKLL